MKILQRVTIKTKLLGSFLVVTLLPLLIVSGIAYWLIKGSVERSSVLLIQDILSQVGQSMAKEVQDLDDMTITLYSHQDILRIIGKDEEISVSEHDNDNTTILSLLGELTRSRTGLFIFLFDFNREVPVLQDNIGVFRTHEYSAQIQWDALQEDPLFLQALENKGKSSLFGHLQDNVWELSERYLAMLRVINKGRIIPGANTAQTIVRISRKPIGMMILCLREDELRNIYQNSHLAKTGHIYLITNQGEVLSSSDQSALKRPFPSPVPMEIFQSFDRPSGYQWIEQNRQPFLLSFYHIPARGLILYTLQPQTGVMQNFYVLRNGLFAVTAISVLIAIVIGLVLSTSFTRPITALTSSLDQLEQTQYVFENQELSHQIREDLAEYSLKHDEIGVMAKAFRNMIGHLQAAQQRLREQERLKHEMELARHIQTAILPKNVEHPDFEIDAVMIPAEEVGGDYYDVLYGQDGQLWLAIGDVSGHGMTPGLIMMMAQTLHTAITTLKKATPREVVIEVNQVLYHNVHDRLNTDHFMTFTTLCYQGNGHFIFAGAHVDLIIYRWREKCCDVIETPGTWLNFLPDITDATEHSECTLDIGDVLILYTDGLIEAQNEQGELLEMERFLEIIQTHADKDVTTLRDAIITDVLTWCGHQRDDDMTLMVVRRTQ